MRTERRWKWLWVVTTGLLGLTVAMPSAVAHTTESLHHMVEHVLDITTSTQRNTSATQQKVSALPADPASTTDITQAQEFLFDAVGKKGFLTIPEMSEETDDDDQFSSWYNCETIVPQAPTGTARLATITVINKQINENLSEVTIWHRPHALQLGYDYDVKFAHNTTFVDTASEGKRIDICISHLGGAEGKVRVHAQWDDRPMVHVDE